MFKKKTNEVSNISKDGSYHQLRVNNNENIISRTNLVKVITKERRLTFCEKIRIIFFPCCENNERRKIRKESNYFTEFLKNQFDIRKLLFAYQEIELMKDITMMEDQRTIFDYLLFKRNLKHTDY